MYLALRPTRRIEALLRERDERGAFDVLEDGERPLARRPVCASACGLTTPLVRPSLHVLEIAPALTAEAAVTEIAYASLDVRLARRVAYRCGVNDESAIGSVLLEGALEDGIVAVRLGDGCTHVIDDHATRHPAEEGPGIFEPVDQMRELLRVRDVDVLVPAARQRNYECPGDTPPTAGGVRHSSQPAEVDLGELARRRFGHAHRYSAALGKAAVLDGKPVERAIGDANALPGKKLMHLGEPEPAPLLCCRGQPLPDLLGVWHQLPFGLARHAIRRGADTPRNLSRQLLRRLRRAGCPPQRLGQRRIAPDRATAMSRRPGDGGLALAAVEPPQHIQNLPHGHLSVRHPAHLQVRGCGEDGRSGLRRGGSSS